MRYTDDYTIFDAAADAVEADREKAIKSLREHCDEFNVAEEDGDTESMESLIEAEMDEMWEAEQLARDPYSYYGVSRSDF